MGHTPGQWYLTANGPCFNLWSDEREQHHAILVGMTHQAAGEHKANAGELVLRYNAHDGLVAACEAAEAMLRLPIQDIAERGAHRESTLAVIRAALAAARPDATKEAT